MGEGFWGLHREPLAAHPQHTASRQLDRGLVQLIPPSRCPNKPHLELPPQRGGKVRQERLTGAVRQTAGMAFQVVIFPSRLCKETWENTSASQQRATYNCISNLRLPRRDRPTPLYLLSL